jgi:DNA invertase Pin-like site-specific DNA recombinase
MPTTRRAFSYARFSTREQMDGRSLRRQEEAAKSYCGRNGLTLDKRSFTDLGVSAHHGANATHGELGQFLQLVTEGRVPAGSVLIVENIDRLSRLPPDEATALITGIVKAGVDVVTTSPEQCYTAANIHQVGTWIPLQVAQCLAHEESRKKGERVADAWADKRARAAEEKLTKRAPLWLRLSADRKGWVVLEDKAALVRLMFQLAPTHGVAQIAEVLHKKCPEGLTGKGWQPGVIRGILRSRTVLGEHQPHTGTCAKKGRKSTRKAAGEKVEGYYPAIVSPADFDRAQKALDARKNGGGPTTGTPNLFNALLVDALDDCRMTINAAHGRRVLVSSGAIRKIPGSQFRSVRYTVFEAAVLSLLAELKPADVLGRPGAAEDLVATLSGKLTTVNRNLGAVRKRAAEQEDVTAFLDLIADLDRQRKELVAAYEQAKAAAANQAADNLGDLQGLVELLAGCPDDERDALRAKVQAALRRLVKDMRAVVVPAGPYRLVGLQVWFHDNGKHRDYLIVHRRPKGNGAVHDEGEWRARSLADVAAPGALDLRRPADARSLAHWLSALNVDALRALLHPAG